MDFVSIFLFVIFSKLKLIHHAYFLEGRKTGVKVFAQPVVNMLLLVRTCFVTMGPKARSPFHHILSRVVVGISSHKVNKTFSFHKL